MKRYSWLEQLEFNRLGVRWASEIENRHSIHSEKEMTTMAHGILRRFAAVGVLSFGLVGIAPAARAGLSIVATVGGAPMGATACQFR